MLMFYFIHSFLITGLFARSVSLMLMFYFIHSFLITGLFARSVSLIEPSNEKTVCKIKHQH
jgi:imidazoleglycerol phosphate synthase glutamine amidotransferase subunit HisH